MITLGDKDEKDDEIIAALKRDGQVDVYSAKRMTTDNWEELDTRLSKKMNMRVESNGLVYEATLTLHRNSR